MAHASCPCVANLFWQAHLFSLAFGLPKKADCESEALENDGARFRGFLSAKAAAHLQPPDSFLLPHFHLTRSKGERKLTVVMIAIRSIKDAFPTPARMIISHLKTLIFLHMVYLLGYC
jgi:hypothetical protein